MIRARRSDVSSALTITVYLYEDILQDFSSSSCIQYQHGEGHVYRLQPFLDLRLEPTVYRLSALPLRKIRQAKRHSGALQREAALKHPLYARAPRSWGLRAMSYPTVGATRIQCLLYPDDSADNCNEHI